MTPEIAAIIERQFQEIQTAHDRIRALRDATAPPEDGPRKEPTAAAPSDASNSDVPKSI